jgi:tetratricopeptide (TPR) repeat protein
LRKWHKACPASPEPIYYEAFHYLSKQDWDKFISKATQYLFGCKLATQSAVMMKYYLAIALWHVKRDAKGAMKHIIECLAVRPLMSEFWCLLGDIFYHASGDYKKAKQFYQNAIIMGSHRWSDDIWPMEISKYGDYPKKMIASCEALLEEGETIVRIPN